MRCQLSALLLAALVAPALAQDNEAEKLFRAMRAKVTEAKAVQVAVTIDLANAARDRGGQIKASVLLTRDNRVNIKAGGVVAGVRMDYVMVSDGTQMKLKPFPMVPVRKNVQPTPKYLHREVAGMMTLTGVELTLLAMPFLLPVAKYDAETTGVKNPMTAWGFKAGATEKVGGRDARAVSFRVGAKPSGEIAARVTLWIDSETLLPRKLVARPTNGDTITEVYDEFRLDPTPDAKAFTVPR